MYKLNKDIFDNYIGVSRLADNAFIPFDPANTDYQRFKQDIADGAELQDADGVVMSPEQVAAFVADLP